MANKKAYVAPDAAMEELVALDVLLGSTYDNVGEDEDWSSYLGNGGNAL